MRITAGSYYNNIYGENNKLNQQLFDVNKQISSGMKIQYSYENPGVAIDTLRLDNEITTLTQVKTSAQSAYKISTQTDTTIGEIVKTIESMKVKMINAANDTNSDTSTQAIAKELRGLQNHLLTLANTSIGGQYLFSGTATSVKPIDANGMYQGNDQNLEAFLGSGVKQKYNISGSQLFLGSENRISRMVTSNVRQMSLTDLYPDIMKDPAISRSASTETYISGSSTIRDLMGDTDSITTNDAAHPSYFYLQGTRTDGSTFKSKIQMNMTDTMDDLTHKIALAYDPNQTNPTENQVNVTINANGQIEVSDKSAGSSKLDFHLVGAVDFSGGAAADVTNIDNLQSGTTDFETAAITTPGLYIKEFTKSGFTTPTGTPNTIEGINYDRTNFTQDGAILTSNVSQIVNADNSFATSSTKLIEVSGETTLDGKQFVIQGKNVTGAAFTAQINLSSAGSTFSLDGGVTNFNIFTATAPRSAVDADQMTYQQMMDVINIATSGTLPTANTATAYDTAITASNVLSSTTLDYAGRIKIEDKTNPTTKASIALYDSTSNTYPLLTGTISSGSALSFNDNSALQVRDAKTDFFAQIEEMIQSVEAGKKRADGTTTTGQRDIGVQNSIQMLDDLSDHVSRLQTEAGSYSQVLQASSDRTDMLIISTKTLQSDVIDTDIAEATLKMQQLSLNYQALLSNISKVSKLSLVNYL
ncbi:flagellar biosynthesis protein FlgL [Sulfuricurvum sp.]|uniref:flagellin N-terminal helical domain-containing protein n=1 Tax=Sulfuricurvum sp. TaxID=2025608 RepID=UPI00260EF6B4|nr:flagellar biosynthesis protein FlgL [Sulfuricurvum sp.]MDD2266998.1 flagellar biosynthesis protein FlgL [Sulfuricurvum sp.]MDD2782614.1 flagellar biosynthesis protein FlgL [Sulfuricurvum sp.]